MTLHAESLPHTTSRSTNAPAAGHATRAPARGLLRARLVTLFTAASLGLLAATTAHAQVPAFYGMGDLAGGDTASVANAISADGSTVVGSSFATSGEQAVRWTGPGTLTSLGLLSGGDNSEAFAVSANGGVIVGRGNNSSGTRGFRWTGSMVQLGTFFSESADPKSEAFGLSGDGLVAVGSGVYDGLFVDPVINSARWAGGGTSISNLGDLSGGGEVSVGMGANSNGSIIVGYGDSSSGIQAWYWQSGSMHALPAYPGALVYTAATAISSDGSTVVGWVNTSPSSLGQLAAARWTGASYSTLTLLGALPTTFTPDGAALAVNGDGSIIVGRAIDENNDDQAIIWDAANGFRRLADVLTDVYGLDVGGWWLRSATGISDPDVDGGFWVVGDGRNPQGDDEGFIVYLATPACGDGLDNDADLQTDFGQDPGCWSVYDLSEVNDCNDGLDNDGDGQVDFGADADCWGLDDPTELPDCSDGIENDTDGLIDFPLDPGCRTAASLIEDPACDDGIDNDGNLDVDYPADPNCVAADDQSEIADCADGLDNDGDGFVDFPADLECESAADESEDPQCSDRIDNDGDGLIDYPAAYPECVSALDAVEAAQCADGIDNDGDTDIDLADSGCLQASGRSEAPTGFDAGDLLVVDRTSASVFAVDPATGVQTLISQGALLGDPQGIAQRGSGEVVVADPSGLVEIDAANGAQRPASAALLPNASLQVVFDGAGDAFVLEADGIHQVLWNPTGLGAKSLFLSVPSPEPISVFGVLDGDSLAIEASGDLLSSGASLYGDGVVRIDGTTATPTMLKLGATGDTWLDLAAETPTTILGVSANASGGPGIYRIDATTGVATALGTGAPFQLPTAVTVGLSGEIYVADAGSCTGGACTGGGIYEVDPGSGFAAPLASGGNIAGEMDLVVATVPEPRLAFGLACAGAWLAMLARRRSRG